MGNSVFAEYRIRGKMEEILQLPLTPDEYIAVNTGEVKYSEAAAITRERSCQRGEYISSWTTIVLPSST